MSSADPSLSLPHQSHTVPPAHPVPPLPLFCRALPSFPVLRSHHPSRGEDPPCHPRALRTFSLIVLSHSLLSSLPPQSTLPLFPSRQPAAIDINLRNFFGASTCHRVTVHPQPGVPDASAEYAGMRFASVMGEGNERRGANEDKRGRSVESEWSSVVTA